MPSISRLLSVETVLPLVAVVPSALVLPVVVVPLTAVEEGRDTNAEVMEASVEFRDTEVDGAREDEEAATEEDEGVYCESRVS